MNKGTKVALIVVGALVIGSLVVLGSMVKSASTAIEKAKAESVPAANEILILVASEWNPADFELRTARGYAVPESRLKEWKDRLGSLVSGDMKRTGFKIETQQLTSYLTCVATFEKGEGEVSMTLVREPGNSWELLEFDVRPSP